MKFNLDHKGYSAKPMGHSVIGAIKNRILFEPVDMTIRELAEAVIRGQSFTAAHCVPTDDDRLLIENIKERRRKAKDAGKKYKAPKGERGTGAENCDWYDQQTVVCDCDNKDPVTKLRYDDPITVEQAVAMLAAWNIKVAFAYYSFSSTDDWPRFHLVIVLDEVIEDPKRMQRIIAAVFSRLGKYCDTSVDDLSNLYFGGKAIAFENYSAVTKVADIESIEMQSIPAAPAAKPKQRDAAGKATSSKALPDPKTKKGIVGRFCTAYNIQRCIDELLPGIYIETNEPGRYTYADGSTEGGAVILDDDYLFSHHGTDPAGLDATTLKKHAVNSFDLVLSHKFASLDAAIPEGTPANSRPSYKAMRDYARKLLGEAVDSEGYTQKDADADALPAWIFDPADNRKVEHWEKYHTWSQPTATGETHPTGLIDDAICEAIIANCDCFCWNGRLYLYRDGVYKADEDGTIFRTIASKFARPKFRTATRMKAITDLMQQKYSIRVKESDLNQYPENCCVNFKNGILNLRTLELMPHSPEYMGLNQIPWTWPPKLQDDGDTIVDDYLANICSDKDLLEVTLEYCGYMLTCDTHLQKLLILTGKGGNGKSDLLRMMQEIIGSDNYSSLTLQNLNDRFSPACLVGKLACIYGDLPAKSMDTIAGVKTLTGEDTVRGEYKQGAIFGFHPYCKLLFSANTVPKAKDDLTDAFYRRLILIPVKPRAEMIEIQKQGKRLKAHIPQLLRMIVDAGHRLYADNDGKLHEAKASDKAVEELFCATDSVQAWIVDANAQPAAKSDDGKDAVNRSELYKEYQKYCAEEEFETKSRSVFYESLRAKGFKAGRLHDGTRVFFVTLQRAKPTEQEDSTK